MWGTRVSGGPRGFTVASDSLQGRSGEPQRLSGTFHEISGRVLKISGIFQVGSRGYQEISEAFLVNRASLKVPGTFQRVFRCKIR